MGESPTPAKIAFCFGEHGNTTDAIGTLKGDRLEIRYSSIMQHSDFEDAAYRRVE